MALDPQLLEILACPDDKGPLLYFEDEDSLYNPRLKRRYAIKDDIPIMLIDEAETVDDAEHDRLLAKAEAQGIQPDLRGVGAVSGLLDTVGMFDLAAALPEQVAAAAALGAEVDGLPEHDAIEQVVVLGMGGSGVAGDVLAAVAGPFMPVPVTVVKGYEAPASVGEGTLCFAISYSGDTEETVEAAQAGRRRRARAWWCCPPAAQLARPGRGPGTRRTSSCPSARCRAPGIGSVSIPPLMILERVGLFPGATRVRRRRGRPARSGAATSSSSTAAPPSSSPARSGAPCRSPTAATRSAAVAAYRFKCQVNENAKAPAFWAARAGDGPQRDLRLGPARRHHPPGDDGGALPPRLRAPAGRPPLRPHLRHHRRGRARASLDIEAEGEGALAQLLDLVIQGDFVSLHLAAEAGVDPGPIPVLTDLKAALAR